MKDTVAFIKRIHFPIGKSGDWAVERYEVSKQQAKMNLLQNMVRAMHGDPYRPVPAGKYYRLVRGRDVIMSTTPAEINDLRGWQDAAHGKCVIAGLGLGVAAILALEKKEVDHVIVLEKSRDVHILTGPWLCERYPNRVSIVGMDVFDYHPAKGDTFDCFWGDIWDDISAGNLEEMKTLRRNFAHRAKWKGFWCEDICKKRKLVENREMRNVASVVSNACLGGPVDANLMKGNSR